ncbi:hypothetical protein M2138_000105 [Dysgonomonadaceae bacterium PH5-43]|nr:hypothetical protein [Dysgonomonadaceae bacterium PH5-43]
MIKAGLDYYPLDVKHFNNFSTKALKREFGTDAVLTEIFITNIIFEREGYYTPYDMHLIIEVADALDMPENEVISIIKKCAELRIFDSFMLEKYGILTSLTIQKRFFYATKRRKKVEFSADYIIDKEKIKTKKHTSCIHDVTLSKESKGKEVKEVKEVKNTPPNPLNNEGAWRNDFKIYCSLAQAAYLQLKFDYEYIDERKRFYPAVNIPCSLEKAFIEQWSSETFWKKIRRQTSNDIDWKNVFNKMLMKPANKVWLPRNTENQCKPSGPTIVD